MRAASFAGTLARSRPSSSTAPDRGASRRENARRRVDLPQAFGPTMTVNEPSRTSASIDAETVRRS